MPPKNAATCACRKVKTDFFWNIRKSKVKSSKVKSLNIADKDLKSICYLSYFNFKIRHYKNCYFSIVVLSFKSPNFKSFMLSTILIITNKTVIKPAE